ncbi:MAG TPA: ABC transporter substrate-binding protein [Alphaproteobacteria bacterium]|nr:ABC transporter substrate-binding protein [Alphaproteobacteria bacterium]
MLNRLFPLLCGALLLFGAPAHAEPEVVRIGVLTDLSGSMADAAGHGSVEAAEMALEDAQRFLTRPVTVITADYQNRSDLAQHISEDWLKRQNIDAVVDVPNAVIASRLQQLFREQGKILLSSNPLWPDAAAAACGMNGIFWLYNRETLASNLIRALLAEHKQRWFILGGDTLYSTNLAGTAKSILQGNGGQVAGEAYLGPRMGGLDSVVEQIRDSHADVVFLAFERPEIMHLLRHWPALADNTPPLAFSSLHISDMASLADHPLPPFYIATSFYWNQDSSARGFADRFAQRNHGTMPSAIHASVYSAVYHYLQSVQATGRSTGDVVLAHMKAHPLQDAFFTTSRIRADGVVMHHIQLLVSKPVQDRENPSDFFRVVRTLAPAEVSAPNEAPCPAPEAPAAATTTKP